MTRPIHHPLLPLPPSVPPSVPPSLPPGLSDLRKQCGENVHHLTLPSSLPPSLLPSLPPGLSDLRKQCGEDVGLNENDRIPFSTTFSGVTRIKYGTSLPPSLPGVSPLPPSLAGVGLTERRIAFPSPLP